MRSPALVVTLTLTAALLSGCTGDDTSLPANGKPGIFDRAAGVDVVVLNEGVTTRNVTVEVVTPSGEVAQRAMLDVPPNSERGLQGTLREQGDVRVVVSAEDYGGGKAEGVGDPWECPGGARLTYTFTLPADPTAEPAFRDAHCGA